MTNLNDGTIYLRALEPDDAAILYEWENDPSVWQYGDRRAPLSMTQLRDYALNYDADPIRAGQLRLVVALCATDEAVGCIDLYEIDATNARAGVGVLTEKGRRGKGYALRALQLLCRYARVTLSLHQLWCNVSEENTASRGLFKKCGFETCGRLRSWLRRGDRYADAYFMQRMLVREEASERLPF